MRVNRSSPEIIGFDSNPKAVTGAKRNTAAAGSFRGIQIYNHDFFKYEPNVENATVIINPPYDVRLRLNDQKRFYNRISKMLYQHYRHYDNWILCPVEISLKSAGFRIEKEYTVFNGPIECRFAKLDFKSKRSSGEKNQNSKTGERRSGRKYKTTIKDRDPKKRYRNPGNARRKPGDNDKDSGARDRDSQFRNQNRKNRRKPGMKKSDAN